MIGLGVSGRCTHGPLLACLRHFSLIQYFTAPNIRSVRYAKTIFHNLFQTLHSLKYSDFAVVHLVFSS